MGNEELKGCHPGGDPVGLKGPDGYDTLSSYQAGKEDMITIIRAEIERRQKENYKQAGSFAAGRVVEDADILSFLSTIEVEEYVELSSSVDNYPKNVYPPSVECEKGMREPLESEKPMNQEGVEEELDKWRHEHFHGKRDNHFSGEYLERASQLDLAHHFAQWGAEHLKKQIMTKYIDADRLQERINEVRAYLKEHGYDTFLIKRFVGQYRLDIMRHEDDFWRSEEYKHCQEILGDNYYEGSYGSDIYSLYLKK